MTTTLDHRPTTSTWGRAARSAPAAKISSEVEVRESPIHGKGVFAKKRIRANTLIGEYEGARTKRNGTYVLWVEYDDGEVIGINGRNALRYLNHSRTPNAVFWGEELYSLCEISPETEITFDYGDDWAHVD